MISFFETDNNLRTLSDDEFLSEIQWKRSASSQVTAAAKAGDVIAAASALQKKLCKRTSAKCVKQKQPTTEQRLLWSRHAFEETPRTADLADVLLKHPADWNVFLKNWLRKVTSENRVTYYELLILLSVIEEYGINLSPKTFWKLWRILLTASVELSHNLEEPLGSWPTRDQILFVQGELPWVAGGIFCDIRRAVQFRKSGRNLLRKELVNCTDTDGTPQAEILPAMHYWLAPLIRVSAHALHQNIEWWDSMAYSHFRNLIKTTTRLLRSDGKLPFSHGTNALPLTLLVEAAELACLQKGSRTRRLLRDIEQFQQGVSKKKRRKQHWEGAGKSASPQKLAPTVQSDWAEVSSLRSDWSADADILSVLHHQEMPQLELSVAGEVLFSGKWEIAVSVDGEQLPISNNWDCSCFASDADADYLELQLQLTDEIKIERQILLSRTEHIALLADVVSGANDARIDYSSRLPFAKNVRAQTDLPTRELTLQHKNFFTRAFPLALPQDRVQSVAGRFGILEEGEEQGNIELHQAALGGIYAPLLLCWHPHRKRAYVDWRKLTVTHDGQRLKTDAASGHRLRLGSQQWFLYHNVNKSKQSRTVLGHHTLNETVFGVFNTDGEVEPILLVE